MIIQKTKYLYVSENLDLEDKEEIAACIEHKYLDTIINKIRSDDKDIIVIEILRSKYINCKTYNMMSWKYEY